VTRVLEVLRTGPLVTVQDRGRVGLAHLGVSRSGAADRAALARANRLVGNVPAAAGLEVLLGGLEVRAGAHLVVAVTGADCPVTVAGRGEATEAVLDVAAGARLVLGPARRGLRAYLAVRGGVATAPVLGSRSRDGLCGLGPEPVRAGDLVPVGPSPGPDVGAEPLVERLPRPGPPLGPWPGHADPDDVGAVVLRAASGPRPEHLDPRSARLVWDQTWHVSPDSDRIGVRLDGVPLAWADGRAELASEPLVRGAVQVPPGGQPVVFLADHPVTGGYPVVAVVLDADTDLLAQVRPGDAVRLRPVPAGRRPAVRPDLRCPWWGW